MEERYLVRFNSFFKTERLSSTYKPVFVKLGLRQDYTEDWYQKLYDSCVTAYHGNRLYFSRKIRSMLDTQ
jgi:hypothetical protein